MEAAPARTTWLQLLPSVVASARVKSSSDPSAGSGAATMSVSVALLLLVFGSFVPPGAATVAVFTTEPTAHVPSVPFTVKVAVPPFARLTVVLMLPLPLAAPHKPLDAVHVQVTPV